MTLHDPEFEESNPHPSFRIQTIEYAPAWGAMGDPTAVTLERCNQIGDRLLTGLWYLDPLCTIHSQAASPEFFKAASLAQTRWRRMLTDNLNCGNKGFRRAVRKVVRDAKEDAFKRLNLSIPGIDGVESGPSPSQPAVCSKTDRHRLRGYVRLDKQLAISGLMLINGQVVEPRNRSHPSTDDAPKLLEITVSRRRCDFSLLAVGDDLSPFLTTSRCELRLHVDVNPDAALYVTPGITVAGRTFNPDFLIKARKAESWWHDLTYTEVGRRRLRELAKSADETAGMLFFHGTLVADGEFYRPGRWPGRRGNLEHLDRGSPDASTVSRETLGLF